MKFVRVARKELFEHLFNIFGVFEKREPVKKVTQSDSICKKKIRLQEIFRLSIKKGLGDEENLVKPNQSQIMNSANTVQPSAASFLVTKHSWKGKYRRVLTVGPESFSTYNPSSMEVTNSWKIADIVGLQPTNSQGDLEFTLTFRKGLKKTDSMRFSSEWRATVLTEGLRWLQLSGNDTASAATKVRL